MSALLVLALSTAACVLFAARRPHWPQAFNHAPNRPAPWPARRGKPAPVSMPQLVRQLAALLAAGRTGPHLWQAMAHVRAMELDRSHDAPNTTLHRHDATLQLILAVQRASTLGLSSAAAIRTACRSAKIDAAGPRTGPLNAEQQRMWLDVAACFAVCEASGAPVAAVLHRLAATLEADHDAAAQRETALAGPKATVRLLTWLPAVGLGLGMLMGVDPLGALFGSAIGWAILAAGLGFAVAGRFWSAKLIRAAATPAASAAKAGHRP